MRSFRNKSGRRDLNPLPRAWEARALPGELRPQRAHSRRNRPTLGFRRMSAKAFAAVLAVLAVIGLLGFGLIDKNEEAIAVGDPAPEPRADRPRRPASRRRSTTTAGKWVLRQLLVLVVRALPRRVARPPGLPGGATPRSRSSASTSRTPRTTPRRSSRSSASPIRSSAPPTAARCGSPTDRSRRPENFLIDPEGKIAVIQRGPGDRPRSSTSASRR